MAFVYGRIGDGKNVLARLHRADIIGDVFGGAKTIHTVLQRFKADGHGVIVYLRDGTAGVPVTAIPPGDETDSEAARNRQWREIGLGAQILKDLGISSIRLVTSKKLTYVGLGRLRHRDQCPPKRWTGERHFRNRRVCVRSITTPACASMPRPGRRSRMRGRVSLIAILRHCLRRWRGLDRGWRICSAALPLRSRPTEVRTQPTSMSNSCWRSTFPIRWIRTSWRCSARATSQALTSREFLNALRQGMHGKVAVTYFEWAGATDQRVVVPWRLIDGPEVAGAVARRDRAARPIGAPPAPRFPARCCSPCRCSTAAAIAASAA